MARLPRQKQPGISIGVIDQSSGARVYPAPPSPSESDGQSPPTGDSEPDLLPDQRPPAQGTVTTQIQSDDMFASITSYPPLGQTTVVPKDAKSIKFSVLIETMRPRSFEAEHLDLRLWHNYGEPEHWRETELQLDEGRNDTFSVDAGKKFLRRWYTGGLSLDYNWAQSASFTIKFKRGQEPGWKWARDYSSIADGRLLFARSLSQHNLSHFFSSTDANIAITTPTSDTPQTLLYSLTVQVPPAEGDSSGCRQVKIGYPKDTVNYFALVRLWEPWLAPRQDSGKFKLDKDAVLVSFLREDGFHVVCLAISAVRDVTTLLVHDSYGNLVIKGRNDAESSGHARVLVAVADSFEVANSAVMYQARKIIMDNPATSTEMEAKFKEYHVPQKPQWIEDWYDGFTYCTWNSLGQGLTEQRILDALKELEDSDIVIQNLIIDDNWQSNAQGESQFDRGWSEFEADSTTFPNGLKGAVAKIRSRYPKLQHVAVWHAMMGYWGGISPSGKIAKSYKTTQVTYDMPIISGTRTVVAEEDITRMYSDFYAFLSDAGVDSVKTDVQFYLDTISSAPARRSLITAYQDAWTLAQLRHFSARAISCMSQSPSIIFHSQLPQNRPTIPLRNSDDFFPEVEASHPWHIFCNAHNSLLTQHLNVVPDWDMFQTAHPWGAFHAAARCVSGGPIYFTDTPGQHDIGLINAMTARTPDAGRRVILRPHRTGKSLSAYAGYKDPALVKVGTYVGYARTGSGIIGVFNCLDNTQAELIPLAHFPGAEEGQGYVVRDYASGYVSASALQPEKDTSLVHISLERKGWAILTAHPVHVLGADRSEVALLGLVDKMTGIAGVLGYEVHAEQTGRVRLWVRLKAVGVLGVWIMDLPKKTVGENVMVLLGGEPVPADTVRVSKQDERVLEVDIEKFWKVDRKEGGGVGRYTWGNELSVEVFIS